MGVRVDEYKFMCWLMNKVPSAIIIRDLFRQERKKTEGGKKNGYKDTSTEDQGLR